MTTIDLPAINGAITAFQKLRRRGSIDFPVLNVAAWLRPAKNRKIIEAPRIAIGGITSAPFLSLRGQRSHRPRTLRGWTPVLWIIRISTFPGVDPWLRCGFAAHSKKRRAARPDFSLRVASS